MHQLITIKSTQQDYPLLHVISALSKLKDIQTRKSISQYLWINPYVKSLSPHLFYQTMKPISKLIKIVWRCSKASNLIITMTLKILKSSLLLQMLLMQQDSLLILERPSPIQDIWKKKLSNYLIHTKVITKFVCKSYVARKIL